MATPTNKAPKKVKRKKSIQDNTDSKKEKLDSESIGSTKIVKKPKVKPEKKKKVKLKPKAEEKNNKKKKKPKIAEKAIDERVIDIRFEGDIKTGEPETPEAVEERDERINYLTGIGTQHPVHELKQNLRNILINSGFNELESSFFVGENEILRQNKIKAGLIFNKIYYLAEHRPKELELGPVQIEKLRNLKPYLKIDIDKLIETLNDFNNNIIDYNQILKRITNEFNLTYKEINRILEVIPELKNSNPNLTNVTLRSNMISSWSTTLAAIMDKEDMPIKVFSTGVWFKREPKLNELSLRSHYGTSCIIMDDKITINNGKVIVEEILDRLGFSDIQFKNEPDKEDFIHNLDEVEIYCDDIEIAKCGLFSKRVLKMYGIDIPVLYINFGLEHMVMVQKGIDDIRELMFPQFYKAWKLSDGEIANAIQFIKKPITDLGKEIESNLRKTCTSNYNTTSPCEFNVWEGDIEISNDHQANEQAEQANNMKKHLVVKVLKHAKDSKLCGPAAFNEIIVKNGDVFGLQSSDKNPELEVAEKAEMRYIDAFTKLVGRIIETKIQDGTLIETLKEPSKIEIGIIKDMEDINLQLDGRALRYVLTNNKKIDVRGPMFVSVEYGLTKPNANKQETSSCEEKNENKKPKVTSKPNNKTNSK